MAALVWDESGKKYYETGVSKTVLYPYNSFPHGMHLLQSAYAYPEHNADRFPHTWNREQKSPDLHESAKSELLTFRPPQPHYIHPVHIQLSFY